MITLNLKPNHKAIQTYYSEIEKLSSLGASHEGAISQPFADLLNHCAHQFKWTLIQQHWMKRNSHLICVDGLLKDEFSVPHGYWEAKDTSDTLEIELKKKFASGYPKDNILFQAPNHAIIWQDNKEVFNKDISQPESLIACLRTFFEYQPPAFEQWEMAVEQFKLKVPELGTGLRELIRREKYTNQLFIQAFDDFLKHCQETINPNIAAEAVEEMLIQHILTERIFRKIFNNPTFTERNAIAREIEKVVATLTSHYFSRDDFLKSLDPFYTALETAAATITDFTEKQSFLNTVYEKFFQGFSVKVADTHGIVYTPQPIVNFMVNSVEDILNKEFGRSLSDKDVHIIDPFVGTGNFIIHIMRKMQRAQLLYKYNSELHCNEVLLLPYYIASMNIEHEYYELTGKYEPFEGICMADTFDIGAIGQKQFSFFTKENAARVERQRKSPIFVIISNPPYNAKQVNENDNNKNRPYPEINKRVSETYAKNSKATNKNALSDTYVKAIRWASDRIGKEGIIAFVNNNSFIDGYAFDGMRKWLSQEFDTIYIMDLGGNVRKNPSLSGTTHNVFGIQVGVSINLLIKKKDSHKPEKTKIYYARLDEFWRKEQKYDFLINMQNRSNIDWQEIKPDKNHNWINLAENDWDNFLPMGTKTAKAGKEQAVFTDSSNGVKTNRDTWAYSFNDKELTRNIKRIIETYNDQVIKWANLSEKPQVDDFVLYDDTRISWSRDLKLDLKRQKLAEFNDNKIRTSLYRPFTRKYLFFDRILNEEVYQFPHIFPTPDTEKTNRVICVNGMGMDKPFHSIVVSVIPDVQFMPNGQCFPFYTYEEDGGNRQENITDWVLEQFRSYYKDNKITKWDIFHYIYAVLHHPEYREKYAANLRRELPRIPFAPEFWPFAKAGEKLAELHVNYEKQAEYKLTWLENKDAPFTYRMEKMKLSADKTQIVYNDFLTLSGIPPETFEYRLGNRSALDWIIDQYQISTDKRSGIENDPNRPEDEQYIIRLIGKVITVSLETVKLVKSLPGIET